MDSQAGRGKVGDQQGPDYCPLPLLNREIGRNERNAAEMDFSPLSSSRGFIIFLSLLLLSMKIKGEIDAMPFCFRPQYHLASLQLRYDDGRCGMHGRGQKETRNWMVKHCLQATSHLSRPMKEDSSFFFIAAIIIIIAYRRNVNENNDSGRAAAAAVFVFGRDLFPSPSPLRQLKSRLRDRWRLAEKKFRINVGRRIASSFGRQMAPGANNSRGT